MGVGTNSMLALIGTAGVAASKIGTVISEANDAEKAALMRQKALKNSDALKKQYKALQQRFDDLEAELANREDAERMQKYSKEVKPNEQK